MRLITLAGSLLLGLSLTTASVAAVAPVGAAARSLSAGEAAVEKSASTPKKSKTSKTTTRRAKVSPALAHRSVTTTLADDHSLADRSLDNLSSLAPERVYDGLLPGEGYSVAYPIYANRLGRTECVELIKGLLGAPSTTLWREGRKLKPNADRVEPGTAIATFVNGRYPNAQRRGSKHAAIFLRAGEGGIWVLDQFAHQKTAKERFIPWHHPSDRRPANNASSYSTVRW